MMRTSLFSLIFAVFLVSSAAAKLCPQGDLNGDCKVNWEDIQAFADQWLETEDCPNPGCADFDSANGINLVDFSILANQWLNYGISLVINEFVASNNNASGIKDPQGEYDDWIEIYNFGDTSINLAGMYLTDNLDNPMKWQIPYGYPSQTTVPAHGFILFWADNDIGDGPLHADFKLDASGEEIGLFATDGSTLIDGITFGEQATNISYGRYPDGDDYLRYFIVTTPLAANDGTYFDFVNEIEVSHERGFYESAFNLLLACDTNGATIRYTLDGTEPTETIGTVYTTGAGIPITTTTCLRAIAYKAGEKPSRTAHTYIFIDDVAQQPTNPSGWPSDWGYNSEVDSYDGSGNGIVPSDYEMDPRVVDNTLPGYSISDALLDIPTVSISMKPDDFISDATGLWANPGISNEYECSIEYIPIDGSEGFQYECKVENHGGSSRRPYRMQKHNLRLTFTTQYGPAKLKYSLFPESPVDTFNQLLLRACFTDSWGLISWGNTRYRPNDSQYIHDLWMKESLCDMGQPSSYGNFVNLYVNGLYFGLFNLTELVGDDFFAEHLGGEREDWTVNKDFYSPDARWNAIINTDVSTIAGYTQALNYIDIVNFADYFLLHLYADAEDWPSHNGFAAANAVSGDGKLRFFVWDQEIVLDYHGRAAQRIDDNSGAGQIFQKMRTSPEFRLLFADRVQKHCFNNGALGVTNSQNRYLEAANMIDKAIVAESARWGDTRMKTPYGNPIDIPSNPNNWDDIFYPAPPHGPWPDYYFTREDSWLKERDCVINHYIPDINNTANSYALIKLLRNKSLYPTLDAPVFNVNGSYKHGGYISISDTLTITDSCSTAVIYYTLDGSDPRVPSEVVPPDTTLLVSDGAAKKAHVPTGDIGTTWRGGSEPYDDSNWTSGTSGVGYEKGTGYDPYIGIDVNTAMYNVNTTCYIRIPFNVDACDIGQITSLTLRMRYDDAFVAYINGQEVERVGFTGTPDWNSIATTSHEASASWDSYDISDHIGERHAGNNILAVHGLNYSLGSTDFLICAELEAGSGGGSTDPSISPSAIEYSAGFNIDKSTNLKARAYLSSTQKWSALTDAVYAQANVWNLRIAEIMYHPQDTNDPNDPNTEYIELKNIGHSSINLNLVKFDKGIDFTFGPNTLATGQYILVVKNKNAFEEKYGTGFYIAGEYSGSLDNGGERIRLLDAVGTTILEFHYKDGWRSIVDGDGYSLTIINPADSNKNNWNYKDFWRASAYVNGSPDWDDSGIIPNPGAIVVNEVMAHSHAGAPDWIELYNTTASAINIGGWYLSDTDENPLKYRFAAGTTIPAYGFIVVYEDVNFGTSATDPGRLIPFALSENGEMVCLSSALDTNGFLTGYREKEDFGASETEISFGRFYKGSTDSFNFVPMATTTPGYANAYPKVGPIVISEIMYNPDWPPNSIYENDQYEYIELQNISSSSVTLYDYNEAQPWKLTDGIDFTFPADPNEVTIPAGGRILVVKNPTAFNWRYPGLSAITYGPYDGKLDNAGERVQLGKPGDEVSGTRFYIRVDRVDYSDGSHPGGEPGNVDLWPTEADGQGKSLTRISTTLYGNDPNNWTAATPTPGS
jgi:hypothetical protein